MPGTRYKPISFSRFIYNINANNPPPITAVTDRLRQVMGPFDSLGFLGGSAVLQYILGHTRVPNVLRHKEPIIYKYKQHIKYFKSLARNYYNTRNFKNKFLARKIIVHDTSNNKILTMPLTHDIKRYLAI
jgi:hypothetical protein